VLSIFYTIMGVSLFVPVLAGLFSSRARTPDALAAMITGVAIVGGMRVWNGGKPVGGFTPAMAGIVGAVVAFFVVQTIRRARGADTPPDPTLQPITD
jgi:solute:Na+ symporter, SSS family